ncbi:OCIA domain-containing protein 1 isoform X3 [Bombyx mandarina]|uniref:OCIA domain-containing protein 1 isoform X3 n=1 Tax=Bombyx mandarina TaxID=7092 RepID=A0A6J2JCM6_BOMMA|nr:OCIA domain-containing protein 1 isoform X3 [Bombyx mandarina]
MDAMVGKSKDVKEEDCDCYAESRTSDACPPIRNVTHPLRYYEFTQDEIKALEECDKESFYQRCVPFSALFASLTYAAVKYGHLKPNPRFGPFPKVTLAVVVGYFLGKLSYQQACAEKLMALPGSYIGQILRDRKNGKIGGTSMPVQTPSMYGATTNDIYSDAGPGSSLDLDTNRPVFSEDTYRPDNEGPGPNLEEPIPARPSVSYDDLRRQNRGQYVKERQDPYRLDPNAAPPVTRPQPSPSPPPATNKYGDTME